MLQWHPVALVYAASALISVVSAAVTWRRRRRTPAAPALVVVMVGLTYWSSCLLLASSVSDAQLQLALNLAIYPGVAAVVAGTFCIFLAIADREWRLTRRTALLLAMEPVAVVTAAATQPWHGLFLTSTKQTGAPPLLSFVPGPLFWTHAAYSYLLIGVAVGFGIRGWRRATPFYRRQITTVLVGALASSVGSLGLQVYSGGGAQVDTAPVFFIVTGLAAVWGLLRRGLLDVVPVARGRVLDTIGDAVMVTDGQGRVVDVNEAGQVLLRYLRPDLGEVVGSDAMEVLGHWLPLVPGTAAEHTAVVDGEQVDLDVRVTALRDRDDRVVGTVLVARDVTVLNRQHRALVDANAELREHVETIEALRSHLAEQAVRDELTGLHNRRHLVTVLEEEIPRALREGSPLSVVLLDVDHFKSVNDRHGHGVGDALLREVAAALAAVTRQGDTVARYGGEEFVAVLCGADARTAAVRADQMRRACKDASVDSVEGPVSRSISVGIATLPDCGRDYRELLGSADRALYEAKAAGRDRVMLASAHH